MKRPGYKYQVSQALQSKLRIGESKHEAKREGDTDGIYSWSTYHNYQSVGVQFLKWCRETYGIRLLEDAKPYIEAYIRYRIEKGYSPSTIKRDVAALCKIYGLRREHLAVELPTRRRSDITRSRTEKAHDKEFSEQRNQDVVDFCKGTGLRKHELAKVKGQDVYTRNGKVYVHTKGKGGKEREVEVLPEYQKHVLSCAKRVKSGELIFQKGQIKNRMDEHAYRREYAQKKYEQFARPVEELPRKERYICRKDKKGVVYDKKAMRKVSNNLGHERISVIAQSYIG